jgi:mono/diheme cytochrome c family protein
MDDFRKFMYIALAAFVGLIVIWLGIVFISACGFTLTCHQGQAFTARTPIPTLAVATLPEPDFSISMAATPTAEPISTGPGDEEIARPSNPGGPGGAVNLTGDATAGAQIFQANCAACHGPQGTQGVSNPGSDDGTVPALNPIDPTMVSSDYKTFATNVDLFVQHGSTPAGTNPAISMPAWGDKNALTQQQIADVIAYVISLNPVGPSTQVVATATPETATSAPEPVSTGPGDEEIARPSNPGGPGDAVNLTGNVTSGAQIFQTNCVACHGPQGTQGVPNPGSDDGTVPALNPIDPTMISSDYKTFATNIDLFVQHGSTPVGTNPAISMPAWGDKNALTQQQIADVIAYVISLNPVKTPTQGAVTATIEAATPTAEPISTGPGDEEIARPSNPGGPGDAVNLTGDVTTGAQIFQTNCVPCHGAEGKQGVPNPGSDDGTVPALNPIDPTMVSSDYKTFATNIDLFVQHGSTPAGTNPAISMPAWGDTNTLTQQQIADVIAYVISLNKK